METALIILADGFEEIEAVCVIDILRRAEIKLTIAGLSSVYCKSARNMIITAEATLNTLENTLFDAIILPGGEPGTTNLENNPLVKKLIHTHIESKKWICAICAAPRILNANGYLKQKKATSFPGTKSKMTDCIYTENNVEIEDNFITSRAPGTAMEFAYTIVEKLKSKELSNTLKKAMLFK